jgi:hypothetical protein
MFNGKQIKRKSIKGEKLRFDDVEPGTILIVSKDSTAHVATGITYSEHPSGMPILTVAGEIIGDVKYFDIKHPNKANTRLIHTCLEGPEVAVYYRGQGETTKDGIGHVMLPDYFEALTHKEGRTILITPILENIAEPILPMAATIITNGEFFVRTIGGPAKQFFHWEVKAMRADKPKEFTAEITD